MGLVHFILRIGTSISSFSYCLALLFKRLIIVRYLVIRKRGLKNEFFGVLMVSQHTYLLTGNN